MNNTSVLIKSILSPSLDIDIILFTVLTYYNKQMKPLFSFPWRGFPENLPIPHLLTETTSVGVLFAEDKRDMLFILRRKKAHPAPFFNETIFDLLDLTKSRMQKSPA